MELATILIGFLSEGGAAAVIGILCAVVAILVWDRKTLIKELNETTQRVYDAKDSETNSIKDIVNRYHQGNLDLIQALNEIKIVLATIQINRK